MAPFLAMAESKSVYIRLNSDDKKSTDHTENTDVCLRFF